MLTEAFFRENPGFNSVVHMLVGIGIGILVTYPLIGEHPVRWGVLFLALGLLGHIYPFWQKNKHKHKKGRG